MCIVEQVRRQVHVGAFFFCLDDLDVGLLLTGRDSGGHHHFVA
jgi:hypothetical protein